MANQTFSEKYQMSSEWKPVYSEYIGYTGHEVSYTVPETGEHREVFVPSSASVIEKMIEDAKAA